MTAWEHIPIHIRLTDRWNINRNYPRDGCRFWQLTEEVANRMGRNRLGEAYGGVPRGVLEYAASLEGDRGAIKEIAGICKVDPMDLLRGIRDMRSGRMATVEQRPLEYMTAGEIRNDPWLKEDE